MASYDDNETNLVEDEYDDLDDFIVGSEDGDNVAGEEDQDLPEAYEDEDEDQEEEEEEEEEEPPVGQQEILSFREQLKANARRKYQANAGSCSSSVQPPVNSTFGTFFGPSTPALAPRLIEAGCSSIMKDIQNVPSRKVAVPPASKTKPDASAHQQKPKIVTQEKRKVDTLRENRDYSNLFSDDADTPPMKEEPEIKPVVAPKSGVEVGGMKPTHSAGKKKVPATTTQPARASTGHGPIQSRVQSKVCSQVKRPLPNGRKTNNAVKNGSMSPKVMKSPVLQPSSNGQNLQRWMQSKKPLSSPAVQRQQSQIQRPPQQSQRQQNHALPSTQARKMSSSAQSQPPSQKGSVQSHDRPKLGQRQLAPSSKPQPSRANAVYGDQAKKKGAVKRKPREEDKAIQMIRSMFKYNPDKWAGRDEDDRGMEADYASIQKEERRSAKLARKEDVEQYQLIQEEERQERARKKRKQREQS
ncbi:neurofilament heavy polypeptide [Brachypodium distachyon]|uniref:SPT2 chromatin protein n=1 Tax=Brachypodium distachyon TaxID=15368 RepID=I1ICD5_BRADI|nr:neurofilament heavy polypeptide [Brachypodium distachyon]KQK00670.1 hypothetical protein BRADI_3g51030v3 [Brachypodium distachyon]|eukprot:XP_024317877.1 neurofilament heavy polypeptide [Brachypodium distachyon]